MRDVPPGCAVAVLIAGFLVMRFSSTSGSPTANRGIGYTASLAELASAPPIVRAGDGQATSRRGWRSVRAARSPTAMPLTDDVTGQSGRLAARGDFIAIQGGPGPAPRILALEPARPEPNMHTVAPALIGRAEGARPWQKYFYLLV
jgi:hypothetical protein